MRKLLVDVTPLLKALELTTKSELGGELIGSYKSRFRGRGVEFEQYADYTSGDDATLIDWKASIRTNKVLVKEYSEERNLRIFFLVDVSNSMVYTSGKKLKAEFVGELVISLAFMMIKNSDRIGFAMFSDKINESSPISGGLIAYYNLIDSLVSTENYGGGYDLAQALDFTFSSVKPKSIVIIISDFIGLKDNKWQEFIEVNSRKFDIITFMVRDPADAVLPKSKRGVVLKDPFSNKKVHIEGDKVREQYAQFVKNQEKQIKDFFMDKDVSFLRLNTRESFVEPVINFFHGRRKAR